MDSQTVSDIQGMITILTSQQNTTTQQLADLAEVLAIAQTGWASDQAAITTGIASGVAAFQAQVQAILSDGSGSDNQVAEITALLNPT